jgi:hypothetical protein
VLVIKKYYSQFRLFGHRMHLSCKFGLENPAKLLGSNGFTILGSECLSKYTCLNSAYCYCKIISWTKPGIDKPIFHFFSSSGIYFNSPLRRFLVWSNTLNHLKFKLREVPPRFERLFRVYLTPVACTYIGYS